MKPACLVFAAAVLAVALAGCGLEGERPNIWLQNDSDQTIVIQVRVDGRPLPQATAKPHTKEWSDGSPAKDHCSVNWEIVDTSSTVLQKVGKVCAYHTAAYH